MGAKKILLFIISILGFFIIDLWYNTSINYMPQSGILIAVIETVVQTAVASIFIYITIKHEKL